MRNFIKQKGLTEVASAKAGEIATLLTLASLITMVFGLIIGVNNAPSVKKLNSQAQQSCTYDFEARVIKEVIENGQIMQKPLTQDDNNGRAMYVINDKRQSGRLDATTALFSQHLDPYTFSPYPTPPPVPIASVNLSGLDSSKWRVKQVYCNPLTGPTPGKGCPFNGTQNSNNSIIRGFKVDCGNNMSYGWIVEPVGQNPTATPTNSVYPRPTNRPGQQQPTITLRPPTGPAPTAQSCAREGADCSGLQPCCQGFKCTADDVNPTVPPIDPRGGNRPLIVHGICRRTGQIPTPTPTQCTYKTTAKVIKFNGNTQDPELGILLRKSDGIVAPLWGVSNDKHDTTELRPIDQFGSEAKILLNYPNFKFKPENINADYFKNDPASVRLRGLEGSKWDVVDRFCITNSGPRGCPINADQNSNINIISGFKVACGVDIEYGWVVKEQTPTPTVTPTSAPVPTAVTSCTFRARAGIYECISEGTCVPGNGTARVIRDFDDNASYFVWDNNTNPSRMLVAWFNRIGHPSPREGSPGTPGIALFEDNEQGDPNTFFDEYHVGDLIPFEFHLDADNDGQTDFGWTSLNSKYCVDHGSVEGCPTVAEGGGKANIKAACGVDVEFGVLYRKGTNPTDTLRRGDLNNDGTINILDFVLILNKWGQKGPNIQEDINGDRAVNSLDGTLIIKRLGQKI